MNLESHISGLVGLRVRWVPSTRTNSPLRWCLVKSLLQGADGAQGVQSENEAPIVRLTRLIGISGTGCLAGRGRSVIFAVMQGKSLLGSDAESRKMQHQEHAL